MKRVMASVSFLLLVPGLQAVPLATEWGAVNGQNMGATPPAFSLDSVAANLQQLAYQVPDEGYANKIVEHHGCNCADQEDPNAEEATAEVADEDFQVSPSAGAAVKETDDEPPQLKSFNLDEVRGVALVQESASDRRHVSVSRTGCPCSSQSKQQSLIAQKKQATKSSKALSLASSAAAVFSDSASGDGAAEDEKPTGIWLNTCKYSQQDLAFWRLTNTAYLRGGIVLKETIAYTDSCKMCEYNNVHCEKKQVELTDGNCLCMWRTNGAEMQTMLLSCSACVTDCIGVFKTFDLGKPEPGMQKGVCLRKKPHKAFGDIKPLPKP